MGGVRLGLGVVGCGGGGTTDGAGVADGAGVGSGGWCGAGSRVNAPAVKSKKSCSADDAMMTEAGQRRDEHQN